MAIQIELSAKVKGERESERRKARESEDEARGRSVQRREMIGGNRNR